MPGDHLSERLEASRNWAARHRLAVMRALAIVAAIFVVPVVALELAPGYLVWTAPSIDPNKDLYAANRPIAFTFLDADGNVAGRRGAIVGQRLSLGDMPAYLPAAFIAMEDRSFYENDGIDIRGLVRAAWMNLRAGHVVAGGSTITQQTAKIVFLSPQRTFARKYEELIDAAALEKSLSKKQILELYLNRIYLGSGAYGVDGAAHVYFGKSARDLSLSEAAMLATLTRAPSAFSPRRDLAAAQARAGLVLRAMVRTGAITRDQADEAGLHPAVISDLRLADARNFFLDTAADEALKLVGADGEGRDTDLIVHTTLEPRLQEAARHALAHTLNARGRRAHVSEGAIVLMKPDGAVSALIGGRDYDSSVFNRATQAKRQPGSAFKPFVYLAALENGLTPWDVREDGPVDINGWTPTNYGGRSYGTVTLADALAHSINTVTAGLAQEIGITSVVDAAHRCGISSPLAPNASLALGTSDVTPLELTTAYAVFASGGERVSPYLVTTVEDSAHRTLFQRKPAAPDRVIASHVNRDLTGMLYGVVVEGTGRAAALPGRQAAGKTGTTQDYRDAWFVGFTPDYVAGVWVGNDDNSPMRNVTGGTLPAAIWKDVMTVAERGLPARTLDKSTEPAVEDTSDTESASTSDDETSGESAAASNDSSMREPGANGEAAQGQQQSPAAPGSSSSFWDWLTGNSHDKSGEQPHASAEPANNSPDTTAEAPPAQSVPERRVESRPPAGPDMMDTPPVGEPDADAGPPPPRDLPDEPPAPVVRMHRDERPPPPRDYPDEPPPAIVMMHRDERPPPPPDDIQAEPPPAIVVHHRERLPPPPPPPPDDDGDGN
ncbi:MAG TPA: PBP1A family penicillin-binding protein [Rhizomicrobium sp.]|nr:PBP1A family penicillin-binding protein [Rhizomicrobium sp.]